MIDNDDLSRMEDIVFSAIPPGDVHFIKSEWSGTSYPQLIEALALYLTLKEAHKAAAKRLSPEEIATVRNCGSYSLH